MFEVFISEEAEKDVQESSDYYMDISEGLNERFLSDVGDTIFGIQQDPMIHQVRYRDIRIALTKTFPFGIHYFIESNCIYIVRILHTSRFFK